MGYSNIIFDFDGTLTDSKHDIAGAQLWVLHQFGVTQYEESDLFRHIGKSLEETFSKLLPAEMHERIPDAARMYSEYYQPRSLNTTTLFPGVRETLRSLREQGKNLAVASTKRGTGIKRATDHFGITDCFAQLQGSEGIPHKPDPTIIRKILVEQGWDPSGTIMVGDTDNDILAGRNAGISTCGVTYGSLNEEEIRHHQPDYVISHFPELLAIV
jgi:phosphoglycolate phosphatase